MHITTERTHSVDNSQHFKRSNSVPHSAKDLHEQNVCAIAKDIAAIKTYTIQISLKLENKCLGQPGKTSVAATEDKLRETPCYSYNSNIQTLCHDVAEAKILLEDLDTTIDGRQDNKTTSTSTVMMDDLPTFKSEEKTNIKNIKNKFGYVEFLFMLQCIPKYVFTSLPVSLTSYFNSLSSGNAISEQESMSNNLLRIASFNNFPRHVNIFASKLSEAGFYYTGNSDEVRCYACGVTNKNWNSGDNPTEIHIRLSPSCPHLLGAGFNNVTTEQKESSFSSTLHSLSTSHANNTSLTPQTGTVSNGCSDVTPKPNVGATSNGHSYCQSEKQDKTSKTSLRHHCSGGNVDNGRSETTNSNKVNDISSLGVDIDKPKYPDYAPLQVRASSFQGWPSYLDQTPHQMATAGFLFAGFQDYTRCFFCGGGLRNWEAGDDPWVEHARWFPKCTFLKQNKGENFIKAVQARQEQLDKENNKSSGQNVPTQSSTATQNVSPYSSSRGDNRQRNSFLDTVAARSALEMGYTHEQVLAAINQVQPAILESRQITATEIMSILLNDDIDTYTSNGDFSTKVASGNGVSTDHRFANTSSQSFAYSNLPSTHNNLSSTDDKTHSDTAHRSSSAIECPTLDGADLLSEENRQLKDQRLCKICLDFDASIAFLPCGHLVCCSDCAPAMRKCPICRAYVKGTVKTFLV